VTIKPITWLGTSRKDVQTLSDEARQQLGVDLRRVQQGKQPRDWKPMNTVGAGAIEIRVRADGAYRLLYVAKFAESIYVLHVFQKKTQQTARFDLAVARARFATLRQLRKGI
jgi:phage-related protein